MGLKKNDENVGDIETGKPQPAAGEESQAQDTDKPVVIDNGTQQVIDDAAEAVLDAPEPEEPTPANAPALASSTAVAVADAQNKVMAELAQEGFEGLELDFSSFTGIVLNGGMFERASTKQPLRSRFFTCRVSRTRPKWAWKSNHPNEKDREVVYSYDEQADGDPKSKVAETIASWKADGLGVGEVKKYIEMWALMGKCEADEDRDLEGCLISMSIPPTSIGRLSGYLYTLKCKHVTITDVVTKVTTGAKVTNVDFPFTPWDFHLADD